MEENKKPSENKPKEPTKGKIIYDHLVKNWDEKDDCTIKDQVDERSKSYRKELIECVETHKKIFHGNFFVDVQAKLERIFKGKVHRFFFIGRKSCPSPSYDQSVYKYNFKDETISFVWAIPDKASCGNMMRNPDFYLPEHRDLLNFVISFKNGSLLEYAKKLNNEDRECLAIMKGYYE